MKITVSTVQAANIPRSLTPTQWNIWHQIHPY